MNDRLIPIEEKILAMERYLEELDEAVRGVNDHLDSLRKEVTRLGERIDDLVAERDAYQAEGPDDAITPPPHSAG